jgi:serine/threonine-protein kinase HipA
MDARRAEILFKDKVAGILYETPAGGSLFAYAPGWTEAIACCLPIRNREVSWSHGLHPFFQHLGSEGWLRQKQARAGRIDEEDDLGLLLRYGADCIGAVGVRSTVPVDDVLTSILADPATKAATGAGRTVSGVQKKLLAYKRTGAYFPAETTGPASFIAKYNHEGQPTFVRNELLSLRLAQDVLGADQVTRFEQNSVTGIEGTALIVERFDRTPAGGKRRLEDFAQILAKPRGLDHKGKYDGSYEQVATAIQEHSALPRIDLQRFFERGVFSILIGNADAHLKNWSLLEEEGGGLRLAPVYDVLNTLIYGGAYDTRSALAIGGDKVQLDRIDRKARRENK